jgi:ribosome-binding protein aMBF1 (putative translation factor)
MKISEMKSADEVLAEDLKDPEFRQEWEDTAYARAVATRVAAYRAEHGLTQSDLARRLGMKQPAIARLEAGEHIPTVPTLSRLSQELGLQFHITPNELHITPELLTLPR